MVFYLVSIVCISNHVLFSLPFLFLDVVDDDRDANGSFIGCRKHGSVRSLLSDDSASSSAFTINPGQCFSIIFRGDWTLDLMMVQTNPPTPTRGPIGSSSAHTQPVVGRCNITTNLSSPADELTKSSTNERSIRNNDIIHDRYPSPVQVHSHGPTKSEPSDYMWV